MPDEKMHNPSILENNATPQHRKAFVLKFGGSSVSDVQRLRQVARRIAETVRSNGPVAVVVSAMGETTDEHLSLIRQTTDEPPKRELDVAMATGEQLAIALLATAVSALGVPAVSFTGWQIRMRTSPDHTRARILSLDD
ncbi:MAG: hypothetical protein ACOC0P_05240, partial [Planctomycetota bacterium]